MGDFLSAIVVLLRVLLLALLLSSSYSVDR